MSPALYPVVRIALLAALSVVSAGAFGALVLQLDLPTAILAFAGLAIILILVAGALLERVAIPLIQRMGEEEARYAAVVDTALDAIITIDEHGTVRSFNRGAERIFGYAADEVVGRNVRMLMPEPDSSRHDGYLRNYRETGEAKIIGIGRETTAMRKDGRLFPIDLGVSEFRADGRRLFTGIIRDLTDRKVAEEERARWREESERKGRLADVGAVMAKVVHDIGNPLSGLSMSVQRIRRHLGKNPEARLADVRPALEHLETTTRHLDILAHELKAFLRERRLAITEFPAESFGYEMVDVWEEEARSLRVALVMAIEPGVSIRADRDQLNRAIGNLIKNALECLEGGAGRVELAIARGNGRVRISVSDTGPGIPDDLDVFGLFETTKAEGTGLGLPITSEIVKAHHGSIAIERHAEGGTTFHIELPTP